MRVPHTRSDPPVLTTTAAAATGSFPSLFPLSLARDSRVCRPLMELLSCVPAYPVHGMGNPPPVGPGLPSFPSMVSPLMQSPAPGAEYAGNEDTTWHETDSLLDSVGAVEQHTAGAMELMVASKPIIALSDACTAHSQQPPSADHHSSSSNRIVALPFSTVHGLVVARQCWVRMLLESACLHVHPSHHPRTILMLVCVDDPLHQCFVS